jgi:hypothetical protein
LAIRQGILPYLFPDLKGKLSKAQEGDVAAHLHFQVTGLMKDDKVTRINAKKTVRAVTLLSNLATCLNGEGWTLRRFSASLGLSH